MSALNDVINLSRDTFYMPTEELVNDARAELAALRATVAEQARALAEAREFAVFVCDQLRYDKDHHLLKLADAWLSAHPAEAQNAA